MHELLNRESDLCLLLKFRTCSPFFFQKNLLTKRELKFNTTSNGVTVYP